MNKLSGVVQPRVKQQTVAHALGTLHLLSSPGSAQLWRLQPIRDGNSQSGMKTASAGYPSFCVPPAHYKPVFQTKM